MAAWYEQIILENLSAVQKIFSFVSRQTHEENIVVRNLIFEKYDGF